MIWRERKTLETLRDLGPQTAVRPIAEAAGLSPRTVSRALAGLEAQGLVNIHRVEIRRRWYVRAIVPVEILWRAAREPPPTTRVPGLHLLEGRA